MKEYLMPEIELIKFTSEATTLGESTDNPDSNSFSEGDFFG